MAKKVRGEDGKVYKVSKPFYKKIWFWIIIILVIAGIGGSLSGGKDKKSTNGGEKVSKDKTEQTSKSDTKSNDFYKVGDTVKVGDVEYTLTSVELSEERNQFADTDPANVVKISYTVKNNGDSDLPVGADVEVYGPDDKKSESYPNDNTLGSVAPGKQMDCVQHFGINSNGEIEIHFAPLISFENAAKFKASV